MLVIKRHHTWSQICTLIKPEHATLRLVYSDNPWPISRDVVADIWNGILPIVGEVRAFRAAVRAAIDERLLS